VLTLKALVAAAKYKLEPRGRRDQFQIDFDIEIMPPERGGAQQVHLTHSVDLDSLWRVGPQSTGDAILPTYATSIDW
jgi:hypothetical protein